MDEIRIKMLMTVRPDLPFGVKPGTILYAKDGKEYKAVAGKYGAVAGICDNGEALGVKPGEFEFVKAPEWLLKMHGKLENRKTIKVISLWQPWASLIMLGIKRNETRGRRINIRGDIGIHATKRIVPFNRIFYDVPKEARDYIMAMIEAAYGSYDKLPTGAVLGIVNVTGCIPAEQAFQTISMLERACGDYRPGRYAITLNNIRPFATPLSARGQQGIWNWNPIFRP